MRGKKCPKLGYMSDKRKYFKVGDLVRVREGTHDERMPDSRTGLIIETAQEKMWDSQYPPDGIYKLWMTIGVTLKFHEMFLEPVAEVHYEEKD